MLLGSVQALRFLGHAGVAHQLLFCAIPQRKRWCRRWRWAAHVQARGASRKGTSCSCKESPATPTPPLARPRLVSLGLSCSLSLNKSVNVNDFEAEADVRETRCRHASTSTRGSVSFSIASACFTATHIVQTSLGRPFPKRHSCACPFSSRWAKHLATTVSSAFGLPWC